MVKVEHPAAFATQTVVGSQEVGSAVLLGVVDQGSGACCKTAAHDQGDRAALGLPLVTFGAIDVDVASAAVAKGAAQGFFPGLGFLVPFAEHVTVSVNHLAQDHLCGVGAARGHLEFNHYVTGVNQSYGKFTVIGVTAMIVGAEVGALVGVPNQQLGAFGQAQCVKFEVHGNCAGRRNTCLGHLHILAIGAAGEALAGGHHVQRNRHFHPKPVAEFLVEVILKVLGAQGFQVRSVKGEVCLAVRQALGPIHRGAFIGDLRKCGKCQPCKEHGQNA